MDRRIVHINITNFMAAVEEIQDPSLKSKPFVVAAANQGRATVIASSDIAFKEGVYPGLPLKVAQLRIPKVPVITPHPDLYLKAQRTIFDIISFYSPIIELRSNGHFFIDLTGTRRIFGDSVDTAAQIKLELQSRLSLDPVIGLSGNKTVSKVATRVVTPHGFASISPGEESSFMSPQFVTLLPGAGKKIKHRMTILGINFMGELASLSNLQAKTAFGKRALILRNFAKGIDPEPVNTGFVMKSGVHCQRIFPEDTNDPELLTAYLRLLVEEAGFLLRKQNLSTGLMVLSINYTDNKTSKKQSRISPPAYLDSDLMSYANQLLKTTMTRRIRVNKFHISLTRLQSERQLDLFSPPQAFHLQPAIDSIRDKFGMSALLYGNTLNPA